jgi:hypothetical protein
VSYSWQNHNRFEQRRVRLVLRGCGHGSQVIFEATPAEALDATGPHSAEFLRRAVR